MLQHSHSALRGARRAPPRGMRRLRSIAGAAAMLFALSLILAAPARAANAAAVVAESDDPIQVRIETSFGDMIVELWPREAPYTVRNFLKYVDRGFYDGLIFHRVIPDFMIQTGGYDAELEYRAPAGRVPNESVGGPRNLRGTLAMARQRSPDSADSQFFVNIADNAHLDADGMRPGYTVFGRVLRGMEVADRIARVRTSVQADFRDVPVTPIVIEGVSRLDLDQGVE
ncbi:MAG TPA: peptidylprolyl isomerase [Pseudomonadales bacterium]|nr:peptidylprolyl isomerase [Pseudomonadales bacterium]